MSDSAEQIIAEATDETSYDAEFAASFDTPEPASKADESLPPDSPAAPVEPASAKPDSVPPTSGGEGGGDSDEAVEPESEAKPDSRAELEAIGQQILGGRAGKAPAAPAQEPERVRETLPPPASAPPQATASSESVRLEGREVTREEIVDSAGPEMTAWIEGRARQLADDAIERAVASGRFVPIDKLADYDAKIQKVVADLEYKEANNAYLDAIESNEEWGHADVRRINKSKKFETWFAAQSETIKALAGSGEPEHGARLVGLYKYETGASNASLADVERKKEKDRKDSIHRQPARAAATGRFSASPEDDDFGAVFDKITKADRKNGS